MIHLPKLRPLMLGAAILAVSAPAIAQPMQKPPVQSGAQSGAQAGSMRHDPEQMAQHRAERLRAVLQLKPSQENALQAFLASMKPPQGAREKMRGQRGEMAKLTTPERLDRMKAMMATRQAEFDKRAAATKRFYAQLDPAQQKAFDAMGPMMGGGHRDHDGKRGEHGRPGMGAPRGES